MPYAPDAYYDDDRGYSPAVANSPATERAAFVQRTYGHLTGAVLALVGIEAALFYTGVGQSLADQLFRSRGSYLVLMLAFIGAGYLAQFMAQSARSAVTQYLGLALYVVVEAAILLPILYIAERNFPGQYLAAKAGIVTMCIFAGLTAGVFISGKDFSFLGPILGVLSFAVLGVIVASMFLPAFSLGGVVFPALMVAFMAAYVVYDTSNVMHHYRPDQHVAASLALFATVATMFYYVLRLFMASRND